MTRFFDSSYFWESFPQLLPYLKVTFFIAGSAVIGGTLLGFLFAFMKLKGNAFIRWVASSYITLMRCTPSIVLLFLVYYGVPAISESVGIHLQDLHSAYFVITTFTLQFAAAMAEVLRSAYLAVEPGQYEAAVSVGLSPRQANWRIVFPQALVIAIPNIGNSLITILQEGALAYTIGLIDVVGKANLIIASNYNTHILEVFFALAIIYWLLSIGIEWFFTRVEKALGKGNRTLAHSKGGRVHGK